MIDAREPAPAGARTVRIRLHGELAALARAGPDGVVEQRLAEGATAKHAIEALDVPHTEVGALTVDGQPCELSRILAHGERVDVHPVEPAAAADSAHASFLADAHLGALARLLRLAGFDTALAGDGSDRVLAALAHSQARILLSRDRELLKHRQVERGCLVRALRPDAQWLEVARRYGLRDAVRPFTRCLECNAPLRPIAAADAAARVPPRILDEHREFTACSGCGRVYWPGSHWRRLRDRLDALCDALARPEPRHNGQRPAG